MNPSSLVSVTDTSVLASVTDTTSSGGTMSVVPSRVIRFHTHGEPLDVLREERTEVPDPPGGTVRVRVLATGLNPADWELCRGFMPGTLPRGIGYDVVGVVDAIGDGAPARAGEVVF